MPEQQIVQDNLLDLQFGYDHYYGNKPKAGWLLSFNIEKNNDDCMKIVLYFVDEDSNNFKINIPFFPSLLIECKDALTDVEEYIKKRFESGVHNITVEERIDTLEHNHLNKPAKKLLKLYFRTEVSFLQCVKSLKDIISEGSTKRYKREIYSDFLQDMQLYDVTTEILNIHEYDIPYEIQVGTEFGIRSGCWYTISYNGEAYQVKRNSEKIAYPDLKIFAFDIETTKPPLKFPNPEFDEVMMISIMTESFGELVINRKIVSEDIEDFEYHAKDEMQCNFKVSNENSEEALLIRFLEIILEHRPHIMTTYNGSFFDWPFISKRMQKYGLDITTSLQFQEVNEYFECPFIIHLDSYKWVKRDSYLPMNNQSLKDVTRIKLGYFPEDVDPEDMVKFAKEDPQRLASYSVSDAVATYFLYLKYVHSHIFSVCSLIPLPPVQILCRGAGTLCESLLLAESVNYKILVPAKKKTDGLQYYEGRIIENLTYVGGHVDSLKAGIYRSDLEQEYTIDPEMMDLIADNLDHILEKYVNLPDYQEKKEKYIQDLKNCAGTSSCKGSIYHLDVGAMYPNIILTNKLQPNSVVNDDICVRCDYNDENNKCKKKMQWISRVEFVPPEKNEVSMIRNQLENEIFSMSEDGKSKDIPYKNLPTYKQNEILKERVVEYSKAIYKRVKKIEEKEQEIYICQREVPFYVETVRKFRDQRYVYKDLYKKAVQALENSPTEENKKNITVYESLQIAYKCILNSFYGYVMREGSRWFSLEMAATVCNIGGQIIRLAKNLVEKIGIPLELDTDGIWGIFPETFPYNISLGGKNIAVIGLILNYFVCKKFTNYQYQIMNEKGNFDIVPQNSIFFELDGPYKTMVIPSSTEENKLSKKRYVVFNNEDKVVELKGFELRRRGELNIIKKFQEEIFKHFNDGKTLKECYESLSAVCNYWLDIIIQQGGPLDDDTIFYLFSESRNMSKAVDMYANRKSNILNTAKRLSEFLGADILEEKLKCEFIISKYPIDAPVVERAIPVMIFKSVEKEVYLKKWLKTTKVLQLREIIDWEYYRKRFENIIQRLIIIPAHLQRIENPVPRITLPVWITNSSKNEKLSFSRTKDIEDLGSKRNLDDLFYSRKSFKKAKSPEIDDIPMKISIVPESTLPNKLPSAPLAIRTVDTHTTDFLHANREIFINFYWKRSMSDTIVVKMNMLGEDHFIMTYLNGKTKKCEFSRELYVETVERVYFKDFEIARMYLPDRNSFAELVKMKVNGSLVNSKSYKNFFNHFSLGKSYNTLAPEYQMIKSSQNVSSDLDFIILSSFNYQKKPVYAISDTQLHFLSEIKHPMISKGQLKTFIEEKGKKHRFVVFSRFDPNYTSILDVFKEYFHVILDISPSLFLEAIENLMKIHKDFHEQLKDQFHKLVEISMFSKIPILNVDDRVLDFMLYREFISNEIAPIEDNNFIPRIIRDEKHSSGYYKTFCVQFECTNSIILSIIEYNTVSSDISLYHGYKRKDFQVLRTFLKNLVLTALKGNAGLMHLLQTVGKWLKCDSKVIGRELREVVEIAQQRYIIGLLSKLKENQYKIVSASKDLIIIDTEKSDEKGCQTFISYLKKKISEIAGYELLKLKDVRIFERLGFIDQSNYFFLEAENIISGFSEQKIPLTFLQGYFSDKEMKNDDIYSLVKVLDRPTLKMILRLLSYKRDVHGLASNCYRLKKCSEFEENKVNLEFNLTVFCKKCGFENFMRKYCIKCYSLIDKEVLEYKALEYLQYCWKMQIFGDRYCNKCTGFEERRLKEYCRCGGRYIRKAYFEEVLDLQVFISTRKFDGEVAKFKSFFGNGT
ncbi:DNA polymerase epsilon catalytic subunit [Glugoides intestinalis]